MPQAAGATWGIQDKKASEQVQKGRPPSRAERLLCCVAMYTGWLWFRQDLHKATTRVASSVKLTEEEARRHECWPRMKNVPAVFVPDRPSCMTDKDHTPQGWVQALVLLASCRQTRPSTTRKKCHLLVTSTLKLDS